MSFEKLSKEYEITWTQTKSREKEGLATQGEVKFQGVAYPFEVQNAGKSNQHLLPQKK